MAAKEIAVKKYVVRSSRGEHSLLETLLRRGSNPAQRLLKVRIMLKSRILLKADVPGDGEGWSGSQIIEAPTKSAAMVYRMRKQLAEDGVAAVRPAPRVPRIFPGGKEGKPIAFACCEPPKGRARWTLRLSENKAEERNCKSLALLWLINGLVILVGNALRSDGSGGDGGLECGADGLAEAVC